jgi:hypothetical protein
VTNSKDKKYGGETKYTKRIWRERKQRQVEGWCEVYKNGEGLVVMMIMMMRIRPRTL